MVRFMDRNDKTVMEIEKIINKIRPYINSEGGESTSTPVWYDTQAETMTTIPTMEKGFTAFLITGDSSRNKVQTMPGGGFSTVSIDLPAAWDSLMAAKGYPALSDMALTPTPGSGSSTSINSQRYNPSVRTVNRTTYYRPNGQRIARPRRGMYIQQNHYINGQSEAQKRMYR